MSKPDGPAVLLP